MPIKPVKSSGVRTRSRPKREEVGYKKPPKSKQFKPGQSGNPKGRPKGTRNLDTIVQDGLNKKIVYLENSGERTEATTLEVMVLRLIEKALKGDLKAISKLIEMYAEITAKNERSPKASIPSLEEMDAEDLAILAHFFRENEKLEEDD